MTAALRLVDDTDDDAGTYAPRPSARWTPGAVGPGPCVACYHGTAGTPTLETSLTLAPDSPESRDPAYWRQHLGAVSFRLEAVEDSDTMRSAGVLGRWGADTRCDGGPVVARPHAEVVVEVPGGLALRGRLSGMLEGSPVYALSAAAVDALRRAARGEGGAMKGNGDIFDKIQALHMDKWMPGAADPLLDYEINDLCNDLIERLDTWTPSDPGCEVYDGLVKALVEITLADYDFSEDVPILPALASIEPLGRKP